MRSARARPRWGLLLRCVLAAACSAAVLGALVALDLASGAAFSIGVASTALLTIALGAGPGLLSAIISGLGLWYSFTEPRHEWMLSLHWDLAALVAYSSASLAVVFAVAQLQRARRTAAAALGEQRGTAERMRTLTEAMAQLVFVVGPDGNAEYVNSSWRQYTGLDLEDTNRAGMQSFIHPDDLEHAQRHRLEGFSRKVPDQIELRYRSQRGEYRWFEVRIAPVLDPSGEPVRWMGTATDIHARKEAEERLRASESRLGRVLDANPLGAVLADVEGHILYANDAYLEMIGSSREQLRRGELRWDRLTPPEHLEKDRKAIARALECGVSGLYEKEYVRPDGSRIPVLLAFASLRQGELAAFVMDVTERRRMEAQLRTFAAAVSNAISCITIYAPDMQPSYINQAGRLMLGLGERDIAQMHMLDCFWPDDRPRIEADALPALRRHGSWSGEVRLRNFATGQPIHSMWNAFLIRSEGGEPLAWAAISPNLEPIKQAEEALRASEKQFRVLTEAMPQMVWTTDADGQSEYLNQRWYEYTGTTVEQARARFWTTLVHPEDIERIRARWRWCLETGEPYEVEFRLRRGRDGAYCWFLVRGLPLRDDAGRITRWLGTCTDIEDQKQAQAELAQAKESLETADARKNEFLAVLSHELRNPLAPIRNSVYIIRHVPPGGGPAQRALSVIDRQVQQMAHLIDDLLDVTRIARGKVRLRKEALDLNASVRIAAEDLRDLFERSGVALEVHITPEPLTANGDRTRIAQMVGNLLQNAAKFTPEGGHVALSLERGDDRQAVIEVRDDGVGMARELVDKLFVPFVQADRTLERTRGGLGLGLALVKGLVELHGGSVSARSDGPGLGSTFTVRLPVEPKPEVRSSPSKAAPQGRRPNRILVIEVNRDAAISLKEALELDRHEVFVAFGGREGIDKAKQLTPDAVICDIGLPELDGYSVARELRADPALRSIHLVALSGYALQEDVARSREAGFDRHLAKPPSMETLERALDERGTGADPGM